MVPGLEVGRGGPGAPGQVGGGRGDAGPVEPQVGVGGRRAVVPQPVAAGRVVGRGPLGGVVVVVVVMEVLVVEVLLVHAQVVAVHGHVQELLCAVLLLLLLLDRGAAGPRVRWLMSKRAVHSPDQRRGTTSGMREDPQK